MTGAVRPGRIASMRQDGRPIAEAASAHLAIHPADPPMPMLCGLPRIMGSPAAFDRLLSIPFSESDAMVLCFGGFAGAGHDVPAPIRRWRWRIAFVHGRGTPAVRQTDLLAAFETSVNTGFDGDLCRDHAPNRAIARNGTQAGSGKERRIVSPSTSGAVLHRRQSAGSARRHRKGSGHETHPACRHLARDAQLCGRDNPAVGLRRRPRG